MSQPFAFPPPPPPPPKPSQTQTPYQSQNGNDSYRGRGDSRNFQQGGRGRGLHPVRGSQRGGYGNRGNSANQSLGDYHASYQSSQRQAYAPAQQPQRNIPDPTGQKRDHRTAFNNDQNHAVRSSRPMAPPAVPSFGVNFASLLPKKSEPLQSVSTATSKKTNLLGLTPTARNDESGDEDDEGEEVKLAGTTTNGDQLQFEYKGQTSSLSSPEEIAAWIAERRRRWPTADKQETAKKEAEEKKQKWAAEKAARLEASRTAAIARQEERQKQKIEREKSLVRQRLLQEQIRKAKTKVHGGVVQTAAQLKAEKLRKKAEKIAQQLRLAEAALDQQDEATIPTSNPEPDAAGHTLDDLLAQVDQIASVQATGVHSIEKSIDDSASLSDTSDFSSTHPSPLLDETSSSGSSSSDSDSDSDPDAAPEELSTKRNGPERVPPASRKAPPGAATTSSNDARPLCSNFAKTGRCKFGRRCHFKHEKPAKKAESTVGNRRKGLYHLMVQKEQEEEREKALRVIIALGEAGVLDEPADVGEQV